MGAPIYLVSACASGEEFVAAFRRYADKNGLFIPIAEPLPPGARSRFALTLRDGGVMIEGEAEIVSSARAPSVVHGRVGMTLRFVEPDEPSRTTLGELERARLAMKPPPPSMPPRPADVPAEPRPVLPPIQGRIDAVNALAECVAIGDVAALGPPLPPLAPAPARSGTRSSLPPIPSRSTPGAPLPGLGVAQRTASATRPPTAPLPAVLARATTGEPAELPITPRATPQPDRLRKDAPAAAPPEAAASSAAAIEPGPTSDTMVAASPPAPPVPRTETEPFARGPQSATITAVPLPAGGSASAPTEIGGPLVEPLDADDEPSARTQIHLGVPARSAEAPPVSSPPVTVHGMMPILRPPAPPDLRDVEIGEPTDISMPPEPPSSPSSQLRAEPGPVTDPDADPLLADRDASARSTVPEVRVVDSESGAVSAEAVTLSPQSSTLSPESGRIGDDAPPIESEAITHQLAAADGPDGQSDKPRRTVLGVAVGPDGIMVLPAAPARRDATPDDDAATGPTRRAGDDDAAGPDAPTVPPGAQLLAAAEQLMPSRVWVPDDSDESPAPGAPPEPPPPAPAPAPAGNNRGLPSGDWMIALDPSAPDGWSAPFHTIPPQQVFDGPPARPSPPVAGRGSPLPGAPGLAPSPAPPPAATAAATEVDGGPRRPSPRPQELPIVEPKVQIDPSLVESSRGAAPPAGAAAPEPPPMMAAYSGPGPEGFEAPALHMMMAVPQPGPYAPHGAPPQPHGSQPAYPLDPGYQDPGYPDPGYQDPGYGDASYQDPSYTEPSYGGETSYSDPSYQMLRPVPPPGMFAGYGDGHYAHGQTLPPRGPRRHLVIVLITAVIAVLAGIAVMLILRTRHEATPAPGVEPRSQSSAPAPAEPPAPAPAETAAAPGSAAPPAAATAPAAAPPPTECFADVTSQPPGADIMIDQTSVIGTTPQRVALPCGAPVELVIRRARLAAVTKTVTPTPEGTPLQVVLARTLVTVKVSSTPAGATVTLGGKSLGVTPTVVKVPAFETSSLTIAKDGYEPDVERVAPRTGGAAVHSVLKKLERKKPR